MSTATVNQQQAGGERRAHSTPDPDLPPSDPKRNPDPDDVPPPARAPVEEPRLPEPPIKASPA